MNSPISGSKNVTKLSVISPQEISRDWITQIGFDVGQKFTKISEIEYWRCNDTNLHWYAPNEVAGGPEFYSRIEKYDWYYMEDKWEFQAAIDLLKDEDLVLEVGVGFGYFLERCRARGIKITGIELSPSAAKRARENGFEILEEDIQTLANLKIVDKFDVVCAFQVLEHVTEPGLFLQGMLDNLKVGGRIILSVPNAAVLRRIDPKNDNL